MNIEKLLSTKERIKILKGIIYLEEGFGVAETARKLKLSKGLVSLYFEILIREGLLKRKKNRFYILHKSNTKAIKMMLNILNIDAKIFKKYKFIKSVGLYGSCAKGTNSRSSDVDLWVKIDKTEKKNLIEFTSKMREKVENAKIIILDDEKLESLKRDDLVFYHSLFFGSIIIYGEENEI